MKKIFIFMLMLMSATWASADSYDLWVTGTQVTDANKGNILGDGTVNYDPATHTLTLTNATLTSGNDNIVSEIPGLVIRFEGGNELKSNGYNIWSKQCDLTLTGTGGATMYSNAECICATGSYLSIEGGLYLMAKGGDYGNYAIGSDDVHSGSMIVCGRTTQVEVFSPNDPISGFGSLVLNNWQQIIEPEGAAYDSNDYCLKKDGKAVTNQWVTIEYVEPNITGKLTIDDVEVTTSNMANPLLNGAFAYDLDSNTLTVKKSYAATAVNLVQSKIANLQVEILDGVELSAPNAVLIFNADATLTNTGQCRLSSTNDCGIYCNFGATLTIKDADMDISGKYGIAGNSDKTNDKLIVDNSTLRISSAEAGAVTDFYGGITLNDCYLRNPEDAKIDSYRIVDADGNLALNVIIESNPYTTGLPLFVGGVQVTEENVGDLTAAINAQGDPDITATGTITYDADSKTLTLVDATIEMNALTEKPSMRDYPKEFAILNGKPYYSENYHFYGTYLGVKDLTITMQGNCSLTNVGYEGTGIDITGATNIEADHLNIKARKYGIRAYGELYMESDPQGAIVIESSQYGIYHYSEYSQVHLQGGTLKLNCGYRCLNTDTMIDLCEPVDSWWMTPDDAQYLYVSIYDTYTVYGVFRIKDGYAYDIQNEWVTISNQEKIATGIRDIEHSPLNIKHSIYDLQGRRVNAQGSMVNGQRTMDNGQLKKGIYIINGKKVVVR